MNEFSTRRVAERGAALLIALVMIFMLSIMGVSAMRGATLEKRMAVNAVQAAVVFQAAESATELVLNDRSILERALSPDVARRSWIEPAIEPVRDDIGLVSTVQIRHTGTGLPPGYSAGSESSGGFTAYRFEVRSAVAALAAGVAAGIEQGCFRIAPK